MNTEIDIHQRQLPRKRQLISINNHRWMCLVCLSKLTVINYFIRLQLWAVGNRVIIFKLTIIGSYNGLSPGRRQAIILTNAGILLIGPLGTNFIEILIEINIFSLKKMHLKMSSGKLYPFCFSLNVLMNEQKQIYSN